jgi:hypothetical protein
MAVVPGGHCTLAPFASPASAPSARIVADVACATAAETAIAATRSHAEKRSAPFVTRRVVDRMA